MFKIYCRIFQFFMKYGAYVLPWRKPGLLEGEGCLRELPKRIKDKGLTSILIVTDATISSLGLPQPLLDGLKAEGIKAAVYDKTVPNPTIDNIEEALAMYHDGGCDGLVAFGGGSSMDCAKCVGARVVRPKKPIPKMKGLFKVLKRLPPFYAVPTTAGTGSEATVAAVVVDSRTHEKYALMDTSLIPMEAVLDPLLTVGLPRSVTSTTGMDALTHAVEAYIGGSNTRETRRLARDATKLVFDNIVKAFDDGSDLAARVNMQRAAYFAGIAFTRAYVGNVHAIAHTLGGFYSVPHGLANAIILPHVLEYYGDRVNKRLAELADVVGITGASARDKARAFIQAIKDLNERMNIPTTIDGILDKDIPTMTQRASHEANPVYPVPVIFSKKDFWNIYKRIQSGSGTPDGGLQMGRIDLSSGTTDSYTVPKDIQEQYIGGKSLAAKIIYDAFDGKVEAFSEENLIVITTSPLMGTGAPSTSRFNISTISPLTGLLVSSNCGGSFGLMLKRAGYDGLVISGKSEGKVYIRADESGISLHSADALWGKNTGQAQELLGGGGKLVIGVAGENLVRYAAVISDERAAGRGGVGAVFGWKGLKGVVADGKGRVDFFDRDRFTKFNKKWIAKLRKHALTGVQLPKLGTAGLVSMMQYNKQLATRNYAAGQFDGFEAISGETLRRDHLVKNKGCVTCPIQCGRVVKLDGRDVKGPELETLGLLGSNLLNDDLEMIIRANHLCDEYGLDTISFGSSVGFAMELCEKGLWDNGLKFGDSSELARLVELTARREGIGGDLAEGVKRLEDKYGGSEFAIHVKGMELAAYEPRAAQGMGLGYATSNRGGDHLNGGYLIVLEGLGLRINQKKTMGKAALTVFFQDLMEAAAASGSCLFTTYAVLPSALVKHPNNLFVRMICAILPAFGGIVAFAHNHTGILSVNAPGIMPHPMAVKLVTGTNMNIGRFVRTGERGYNLERLINLRQGVTGFDDTLPKRLTDELQSPGDAGSRVRLDKMLGKYYRIRGWDESGVPTAKRLKKLGIYIREGA